jgi:NTE family protein
MSREGGLALVMSGGGARAAYQVGLLRVIGRRFPHFAPPILTGVSAGAINAAFLAAHEGDFQRRSDQLKRLWSSLSPEQVYRIGSLDLARNVLRTGLKLVSGGLIRTRRRYSLVDTSPLRDLLQRELGVEDGRLPGIERNMQAGRLRSVAITASSYTTGQSITFIQGEGAAVWESGHRRSTPCDLRVEHVMASASLPLLFPAVRVDQHWYGDGGIRLTAPLSPAVHLGARAILAISTRYNRSPSEAREAVVQDYPPIAQMAGVLLNAIFLDLFDADAITLERMNRLVARLPHEERGPLHTVDLLILRPSRDLGRMANEYEARLPAALRFMTRGLGTKETRSNDLLSLIMFQQDYLQRLIALGEEDAEQRFAEVEAFLERTGTHPDR